MKLIVYGTTGPWVVKLSGIAGGVGLYYEEIEAAARAGYRVIALDTSGDRRDDPAPTPLTWDFFAAEIETALVEVGAERAILWGTSFGCAIAMAAAKRLPDRVSGVLLCHPPDPLWRPRPYLTLLRWMERAPNPDLATRIIFSLGFCTLTSWEALTPPFWLRFLPLVLASLEAATPAATVRRKLELLFEDDPGLPPAASAPPVEIIAGAWDLVAPLAGAQRVAARYTRANLSVMAYSGHAGAYTRPGIYHRIVLEALARLQAGG